jgi:hypothetical protein
MHWQFRRDSTDGVGRRGAGCGILIGPGKIPERRPSSGTADPLDSPGNKRIRLVSKFPPRPQPPPHRRSISPSGSRSGRQPRPRQGRITVPRRTETARYQDGEIPKTGISRCGHHGCRSRKRRRGRMPQRASPSTTSLVVPMTCTWLVAAHPVASSKIGCRQNENCDRARSRASSDAAAAAPRNRVLVPDTRKDGVPFQENAPDVPARRKAVPVHAIPPVAIADEAGRAGA